MDQKFKITVFIFNEQWNEEKVYEIWAADSSYAGEDAKKRLADELSVDPEQVRVAQIVCI